MIIQTAVISDFSALGGNNLVLPAKMYNEHPIILIWEPPPPPPLSPLPPVI